LLNLPLRSSYIEPGREVVFIIDSMGGTHHMIEYWGGAVGGPQNSGWKNSTVWSVGPLPESDSPYYWRAKSWDVYGESDWSQTSSFYVGFARTPGDLDDDGDVDLYDYNSLLQVFGTQGAPGFTPADIDIDGDVDLYDYNMLLQNFGITSARQNVTAEAPVDASVPNPPSNVLLAVSTNENRTFVRAYWEDNADNEEGFELVWKMEGFGGSDAFTDANPPSHTFRKDTTSALLAVIQCDHETRKQVATVSLRAINTAGESEYSYGSQIVMTPACSSSYLPMIRSN
jgi:hypothetical protein